MRLALIGAPTSAGAFAPGQEDAPAALRAGEHPLVLGGDCTVGVGTVAGAVAAGLEPRLVYLDLHPDLNTPESVPDGAFDWTGVAHMLDIAGADERLAGAGPRRPLLSADDLVLLGVLESQSTPAERAAIEAGGRPFLVHFDVDVIDVSDVPLSENTGRGIGVAFDAAFAALDALLAGEGFLGLSVTELNPHHGAQDGSDVARFAERLGRAYRSAAGQAIR